MSKGTLCESEASFANFYVFSGLTTFQLPESNSDLDTVSESDLKVTGQIKCVHDFIKSRKEKVENSEDRNDLKETLLNKGLLYKPHSFIIFSKLFDIYTTCLSSSHILALQTFRKADIIEGSKDQRIKDELRKHPIGKYVMLSPALKKNHESNEYYAQQFNTSMEESPLIGIVHIKLRTEFFQKGNKETLAFLEKVKNKIPSYNRQKNKFVAYLVNMSWSEFNLLIPTDNYTDILDISKMIRNIMYQEKGSEKGSEKYISCAFKVTTTLGFNWKCLKGGYEGESFRNEIDNEQPIDFHLSISFKSGVDVRELTKEIGSFFGKRDLVAATYVEGKYDCIFLIQTTAKDYVDKLNTLFISDKKETKEIISKLNNFRTTIGTSTQNIQSSKSTEYYSYKPKIDSLELEEQHIRLDSYLNSRFNEKSIAKLFCFNEKGGKNFNVKKLKEALERAFVSYPIRQILLNLYYFYDNRIRDKYDYYSYIDLYGVLKETGLQIIAMCQKCIQGEENIMTLENEIIDAIVPTFRDAFENRIYSSYHLESEHYELNLQFNGGIITRLNIIDGVYKILAACFGIKNVFVVASSKKAIVYNKHALYINFNYLFKIENLFSIIIQEIPIFINSQGEFLNEKQKQENKAIIAKLKTLVICNSNEEKKVRQNIESLYKEIDDANDKDLSSDNLASIYSYRGIIREVLFKHVVKDALMMHILYFVDINTAKDFKFFTFWVYGAILSDRRHYYKKQKRILGKTTQTTVEITEASFKDIVLRSMLVFLIGKFNCRKITLETENISSELEDYIFLFKDSTYLKSSPIQPHCIKWAKDLIQKMWKSTIFRNWIDGVSKYIQQYRNEIYGDEEDGEIKKYLQSIEECLKSNKPVLKEYPPPKQSKNSCKSYAKDVLSILSAYLHCLYTKYKINDKTNFLRRRNIEDGKKEKMDENDNSILFDLRGSIDYKQKLKEKNFGYSATVLFSLQHITTTYKNQTIEEKKK